jgi:hypothetical protein
MSSARRYITLFAVSLAIVITVALSIRLHKVTKEYRALQSVLLDIRENHMWFYLDSIMFTDSYVEYVHATGADKLLSDK